MKTYLGAPFLKMFQSTRPRGARPKTQHCEMTASVFQSTRPVGRDL